jgi:hypothetical protein
MYMMFVYCGATGQEIGRHEVAHKMAENVKKFYRHVQRGLYPYAVITNGHEATRVLNCNDRNRIEIRVINLVNHTNEIFEMDS